MLQLNLELCREQSVLLVSLQVAEVQLVAGIGVFQPEDVSLRNYQCQGMDVLAMEMWSSWKEILERIEDRIDLWISYWKRIEKRSSYVVWDITTVTTCMKQKGFGRRRGSRVFWCALGDGLNTGLLKSRIVGAGKMLGLVWGRGPSKVQALNSVCWRAAMCRGEAGIYCWSTSVCHKSGICF